MNRFLALLLCITSVPAYCSEKSTKPSSNIDFQLMPPIKEESSSTDIQSAVLTSLKDDLAMDDCTRKIKILISQIKFTLSSKKIQAELDAILHDTLQSVSPRQASALETELSTIKKIVVDAHKNYHAQHKHHKPQEERKK